MEYLHGGDRYLNRGMLDFSANINPLGMPKGCMEAAIQGISESIYYPDYEGRELVKELSKVEGCKTDQIILGNGAAELIYAICYALLPKKALLVAPCFQEYELALKNVDCKIESYFLQRDREYQLEGDFIDAISKDTDIVFLCNPNNPTGGLIEKELLIKIAKRCREYNAYLIIDECFLPFLEEETAFSMKTELKTYSNLLILRAFTKVYAMPGLRLGYIMSSNADILQAVRCKMQPWNTSMPAQFAGLAALKDREFLVKTRQYLCKERMYLEKNLRNNVYHIYKGHANYIFFEASIDLYDRLRKKKIIIRDCSNFTNLDRGAYRIAIRTHEENETLIKAL